MDDLLGEFLTETAESLDVVDVELVKFEKDPNNSQILDNIFRLVHTIKGTCGFLGLPRLEALAHAAETLMGKFRDGATVTGEAVSQILVSIDRIKDILNELETRGSEPEGSDDDLISQLDEISAKCDVELKGGAPAAETAPAPVEDAPIDVPDLSRELKPGEVSLDDLERAFQETEGPVHEAAEADAPISDAGTEPNAGTEPQDVEDAKPQAAVASADKADKTTTAKSGERKEAGGGVKTQSIRVSVDTLEQLMTMVSELVLTRNQLLEMSRRLDDSEFKVPLQRLSSVTAELQEGVMKTRMQPVGSAWQKLPRIIRDLSNELGKKIDLQMHGADTELDRQVLELIKDPLTHMVRNSADHGIEANAEDRLARGKSETGIVRLSAFHEGGHIIIEIADDGRGLNVDKIKEKAIQNGVATEAEIEDMPMAQIHRFIFAAGFSTATNVTSVSGRGVGMDVVRTNIELIGGSVDVKSVEGQGSTFTIKIPLTLAIVSALIVKASSHRFAMPQLNVVELVRANAESEHRIEQINRAPVLRLRDRLLPLVRLTEILGIESEKNDVDGAETDGGEVDLTEGFIIVTQVGAQNFGIVVDGVFDTEEIVVKPMSTMLRDVDVFSGNTILGDGSVILIIDPNGIAQRVITDVAAPSDTENQNVYSEATESPDNMSMLLFRAGSAEPKAVPLSLITRLEQLEVSTIETVDDREMVQYRGQLMPLLRMPGVADAEEGGRQPILVFSNGNRSMGLAVDEIVDIISERLDIQVANDMPGKIGSAIIREQATEVIDVGHYIGLAFDDWTDGQDQQASHKPKLLLVDDSAFFRDMLAPVLISAGYEVTAVSSARQALDLKENGRSFDVIVSDIEMPEIDGYHFAESLKDDAKWGRVPIVALSCNAGSKEVSQGRDAGFFDLVGKFDREGLVRTLGDSLADLEDAA